MGWEDPTFIEDFNTSPPGGPLAGDPKSEGDDHIRSIKDAINASFPNTSGAWTTTDPITIGSGTNPDHAAQLQDIPAPQPTLLDQVSYGRVETESNGTVTKISGTNDWTIARTSQGVYRITFTDAATTSDDQVMLVSQLIFSTPTEGFFSAIDPRIISATQIDIYSSLGGNEIDGADFNFQRIRY